MGVGNGPGQLFIIEIGVGAMHTHIEALATELYSIRSGADGGLQYVPVADGGKNFHALTSQFHLFHLSISFNNLTPRRLSLFENFPRFRL